MTTVRSIYSCLAKSVAACVVSGAPYACLAADQIRSASAPAVPPATASGASFNPVCNEDGQRVVFVSEAHNILSTFDPSTRLNVFLREVPSLQSRLISIDASGLKGGNGDSYAPALASNAIVFVSDASNLVANDTNNATDIFLRDLISNQTLLISQPFGGTGSAVGDVGFNNLTLCDVPQISADGRWIAYESRATNLVAWLDGNHAVDVFVRDQQIGTTLLISRNAAGTASANGASDQPSLARVSHRVAFVSRSTDLHAQANSQQGDVYVRDLISGDLVWASSNAWSTLSARSFAPRMSEQGGHVLFFAASLPPANNTYLLRFDLQAGQSQVVASNELDTSSAQISADGRYVAYVSGNQVFLWDAVNEEAEHISVNLPGGSLSYVASRPVMNTDASVIAFLGEATDAVSQFYVRDRVHGSTTLGSVGLNGLPNRAELDAFFPALSGDGRWLAFESTDPHLVPEDGNHAPDVFLRDLQMEQTLLISARGEDLPARTGSGRSLVWPHSISRDGRRVAFSSLDSDLAPKDENHYADGFVYDAVAGTNMAVSAGKLDHLGGAVSPSGEFGFQSNGYIHSTIMSANGDVVAYVSTRGGIQRQLDLTFGGIHCVNLRTGQRMLPTSPTPMESLFPALSPNGQWLAFSSQPQGFDTNRRLFLAELNQTEPVGRLVSRRTGSANPADGNSIRPQFSPDGARLLFLSDSRDLTTEFKSGYQLYAYEMGSSNITMVSRGPSMQGLAESVEQFVFSGDSRLVALQTFEPAKIYRNALTVPAQGSELICTNCVQPSLNQNGSRVVYAARMGPSSYRDVYLQDTMSGQRTLLSANISGTGGGNGDSFSPLLTPDGRFVVFASHANDLVNNDGNGRSDIFLRDIQSATTLLLSLNAAGTRSGNNLSSDPILSGDGRTVVFGSFASDLVVGDYNQTRDVFVVRLGASDGDGDGMNDDWEITFFETLDRDGTGDLDEDGSRDLDEFHAGTDPTNEQSVLRAITVRWLEAGGTTVLWSAVAQRRYQVQYTDTLTDAVWATFPGIVTAQSSTGSYVDTSASGESRRFYRILLVP